MAEYSGMSPSIMSPHQFGGVAAIEDTSGAPSGFTAAPPDANRGAPTDTQQDARMVLATTDQAARRTSNW
jgi:hypothetical protein